MEPPPRSPSLQRGDSQELFFDLADRVIGRKVDNDPAAEMYDTMMNIPLIGDLSNAVEQGYSALKHVSMQKADEVIALQASKMISSIGATVLNSLHDHAMPRGVHDFVDESYGELWPEVKRSLLDSVMLDLGLEFRAMRANMHQHDAEPPKGWLKRAAARLIYAMEPYDLTIWGTIRSPLSLLIQLTFLFPFYGVSDICVILLAASKYFTNFNECVCRGSPPPRSRRHTNHRSSARAASSSQVRPYPVHRDREKAAIHHVRPRLWLRRLHQALHLRHAA